MKSWILDGDLLEIADGEMTFPALAEQVYKSVLENREIWPDLPVGKCGDAVKLRFSRYPVAMVVVVQLDQQSRLPKVTFEAQTQEAKTFPVSRKAFECGHVVHGTTWYPTTQDNIEALKSLLAAVDYDPETRSPARLLGLLTLKKMASEGGLVVDRLPDDALTRTVPSRSGNEGDPCGITAKLYPYQRDGWLWLRFVMQEHLGGLLADEMGLGKTLQIISALRDPGAKNDVGRSLILAPGSVLENWTREIARFCPDLRALKHHGRTRTGSPSDFENFDIVISSYDTAVWDLSLLKMIKWNVVVLDEAQNIRNPNAIRTRSVKQIGRDVGLAVTGTPIENRLRDLWSIMDFAVPGYLGDLEDFERRYSDSTDAAAKLEPLISPLMLRRRVSDVAGDLPERIDIRELLELGESEAVQYDDMRKEVFQRYGKSASLVALGKLRQFCAHPDIVTQRSHTGGKPFSKLRRLQELLEEIFALDEKALVFTSYTVMADRIARMASNEFGIMSRTLDGRTDSKERQPLIDEFSEALGAALLVLNPRAGGSGLNITAANHVIHYNPEWNPALEDQASARAHRRGQVRPVVVRRLIYAGTVEEVIDERLRRKRRIVESAVVGVEGRAEDYEDILAALERSPFNGGRRRT